MFLYGIHVYYIAYYSCHVRLYTENGSVSGTDLLSHRAVLEICMFDVYFLMFFWVLPALQDVRNIY